MDTATSPLIADDDEDTTTLVTSSSANLNTSINANDDNLELINKQKSIIESSSSSTTTSANSNLILNNTNSQQLNIENRTNSIESKLSTNDSITNNNNKSNIIIPNITVHAGPPPKRNVAVKNTSAHLNFNRNNYNSTNNNNNNNNNNNKPNSVSQQSSVISRVNEDEIMNIDDKEVDSNDEYVPPKTIREEADLSDSGDDLSSLSKRKSTRIVKRPKILDEFVVDSDNNSSSLETPKHTTTSRITIESNLKQNESQSNQQKPVNQTNTPTLVTTTTTTAQTIQTKSTARKSTAPLTTSNLNQFNIQRQQQQQTQPIRQTITQTTPILTTQNQNLNNLTSNNNTIVSSISLNNNLNKPTVKQTVLNGSSSTNKTTATSTTTTTTTVQTQNSNLMTSRLQQTGGTVNPIILSNTPQQPVTSNSSVTTQQTKQTRNKMVSCKPFCQSKATECYPIVKDASTQIDLDEIKLSHTIVPLPVPINVPVPMCMYQAPMPIPILIPVPIPVPVFIPTTKKTFDRVQRRIKKLRKKLPSDPYEFEILLYAEKLAREEGIPGFEDSSDGESDTEPSSTNPTLKPNYLSQETQPDQQQDQLQQLVQNEPEGSFKWSIGVKVFNSWLVNKIEHLNLNSSSHRLPNDLLKLKNEELNILLSEFLTEVRKPNGEIYAPESIYYICLGIQYYLQEKGRVENIFLDSNLFDQFQETLNEIATRYKIRIDADGLVASRIEEEILWESKQLGAFSPFVLLNTILYFNTKYFFLDKVESHKKLSFSNVKKHSKRNIGPNGEDYGKTVFLRYYPDFHGLEQVIYEQGENYDNPLRCPVELYNFYLSKCPESVKNRNDVFYLLPEKASLPTSPVWFSSQPLGDKMLERMLNRIKMVKEVNELLLAAAPATTSLIVQ